MNAIVVDLLFGLIAMVLGALGASWLIWSHFHRKLLSQSNQDVGHAARILVQLQDSATRVAFDIDEHNDQVEKINQTLTSAKDLGPAMIVEVVAKLIEANQQMHEKLASTENRLREQAQEMQVFAAEARTDSLTMLVNRRAFDDELARRCAEYTRQGHTFSLIMGDLDHFKEFNDTNGHLMGDEILRRVAKVLHRKMREMDLVARYGGEEFGIILPGTNLSDAEKAALRACNGLANSVFHHDEKEFHVTMSFGVAEILDRDDEMTLVARADKALYAAKRGGRNCIYQHDGETVYQSVSKNQPTPSQADSKRPSDPIPEVAKKDTIPPSALKTATSVAPPSPTSLKELYIHSQLKSRSNFCEQVRYRTAAWKRGGPVFSVILIEVNQNGINDVPHNQQTHLITMQAVVKFLTAAAREMDVISDYGPGCIAMLLPAAELANSIQFAERLREEFSCTNRLEEDEQSRLTLSIGAVQIMRKDDSISVLKRVEEALDAANRRGGDRAYYHDGLRCAPISAMFETMDHLS